MIRPLFKGALAVALAVACGQTVAMCIGFSPAPGEQDPLKAEVKWGVDRSAAVFSGTVTAMEYVPAHSEYFGNAEMLVIRMAADSWWKGTASREVTLQTITYRSSDGRTSTEAHEYRFEVGKKYLVYAHTLRGGLHTSVCSRTKSIEAAAGDIESLNALKAE